MRSSLLLFPLLAPAAAVAAPDSKEIVEIERAFAALAAQKGISTAFRTYAAEDGVLFTPDPRPAQAFLAEAGESPGSLRWWPAFAGIAQSGDLAFTTGPFVQEQAGRTGHGWFFTIWRRQKDGSWKWMLDHGTPTGEASTITADAPHATLAPGQAGGTRAAGELAAIEARLDRG
ncbi:hypothetical protein E2493_14230, partial [Sphingomonas parva]